MQITSVQLTNVRNHTRTTWTPASGITMLHGPNGSGKSTLLEAIRVICLGSSWRTKRARTLVQFEQPSMQIDLTVKNKSTKTTFACLYQPLANQSMTRQRNHREVSLQEIIGTVPLVVFTPDDSNLISGGPQQRRVFLDQIIAQHVPTYLHTLRAFKSTLSQRNQLLKQIKYTPSLIHTLDVWDEQFAQHACAIQTERHTINKHINDALPDAYNRTSDSNDALTIQYHPTEDSERLIDALVAHRNQDIRKGQTSIGPHRDTISIMLNGHPVEHVGSRGEQRSTILALKRAEFCILQGLQERTPIVLLDDVLSEIDPARQERLLTLFDSAQVLGTTTYIPSHLERFDLHTTPVPHNNTEQVAL